MPSSAPPPGARAEAAPSALAERLPVEQANQDRQSLSLHFDRSALLRPTMEVICAVAYTYLSLSTF
jgi:hypothetical protein